MKKRILSNWTLKRALYLLMGIALIILSIASQQWFGIAFGAYYMAMGIFAFGCASGDAYCAIEPKQKLR